jgi:hypothetical protein
MNIATSKKNLIIIIKIIKVKGRTRNNVVQSEALTTV